jgi:hypothetical protein
MAKGPSPLLGYNTNVRHKGRVYHIQTEDSGIAHPHIITHLFADGGRIVASRKTSYAEHVQDDGYAVIVKKMMQDQHKALFIALRDGIYDAEMEAGASGSMPSPISVATTATGDTAAPVEAEPLAEPAPKAPLRSPQSGPISVDVLERAAAARANASHVTRDVDALERAAAAASAQAPGKEIQAAALSGSVGRYQSTRPAVKKERVAQPRPSGEAAPQAKSQPGSDSIFGGDLVSERSLDEVILSYLAADLEDET